jgi:hypothetical protein
MKSFFYKILIATLVMLARMPSYSEPIDVLRQSYSISGAVFTFEPAPDPPGVVTLPFSSSGSSPVYLTDIYPSLTAFPFVNTYAIGTVDPSTVFLKAAIDVRVVGQSVAQITFRPGESGLLDLATLSTDGGADARWSLLLLDVTTGNTLLSLGFRGVSPSAEFDTIAVDSSHDYMLTDSAVGFLGDAASVATTLSVRPVPEVSNTLVLLVMSLAGVVGLRKLAVVSPRHCTKSAIKIRYL